MARFRDIKGFVRATEGGMTDHMRPTFSRRELTPFSERGGAVLLEDIAADEVAIQIEMVVQRGVNGGEFLQGFNVPELRLGALASSKRLV